MQRKHFDYKLQQAEDKGIHNLFHRQCVENVKSNWLTICYTCFCPGVLELG